MTAKCANPDCENPFHYFRSGTIYLIDARTTGGRSGSKRVHDKEYFWLCGKCSPSMRVTVNGFGEVAVERVNLVREAGPEEPENKRPTAPAGQPPFAA